MLRYEYLNENSDEATTVSSPTKVYVAVTADFMADGTLIPRVITWENGEKFTIDKVTEIRSATAMKVEGQGDRYTIMIHGKQSYLYFEQKSYLSGKNVGRWYVERTYE